MSAQLFREAESREFKTGTLMGVRPSLLVSSPLPGSSIALERVAHPDVSSFIPPKGGQVSFCQTSRGGGSKLRPAEITLKNSIRNCMELPVRPSGSKLTRDPVKFG